MARDLYYEPDNLFLPDEMIEELSQQEPTPFYLYDAKGIRNTSQKIFEAFSWNDGYRQYFPVKAANFPGILRLILALGQGLLCTTGLEVELARRSGAQANEILYAPIFQPRTICIVRLRKIFPWSLTLFGLRNCF